MSYLYVLVLSVASLTVVGCCCGGGSGYDSQPATSPSSTASEAPQVADAADEPEAELYADLSALLGNSQEEAAELLGSPSKCETVNPHGSKEAPKCYYREGNIEVVFFDDRADWITVYGPGESPSKATCFDAPFEAESLKLLGLDGEPTATSILGIFFQGSVPGTVDVSIFGKPGELRYVYVMAYTK